MKKEKILLHAIRDDSFLKIQPIKKVIPEWYKDCPTFIEGDSPRYLPERNLAIKACVPFLDSLMTGYYIPLSTDVIVESIEGEPYLSWGYGNPVSQRSSKSAPQLPIPSGCSSLHLTWMLPSTIELPKGYSALFTHPLNRFDLPFISLSGVVDGGFTINPGSYPFFIKKDFVGIIPRGTPIIQIIPFKTENWTSKEDSSLVKKGELEGNRSLSKAIGWYKHNRWTKKGYR